ncbi:hypothetical protein [Pelobacter seleniigenes]|uniref:hypothetical protein n=1 Tax=Pelobacter seleniigenes TaxID=407188 RepID=UPI0004A724C7|nr:hypothetical protein [Pelobacter seleniigenes]
MKPIYLSVLLILVFSGLAVVFHERSGGSESFARIPVDAHGPRDLWGKSVGDEYHDGAQAVDIDNDGGLDIVSIG